MGLRPETYITAFGRANLLAEPRWSAPAARAAAERLAEHHPGTPLVLLGARVAAAFGFPYAPAPRSTTWTGDDPSINYRIVIVLPHPSGRCRAWSNPAVVSEARRVLRGALPGVPFGEIGGAP
jgi:hypothetical protein